MKTPRLLFSEFKMQTVFTSKNKGFSRLYDRNSRKVIPTTRKNSCTRKVGEEKIAQKVEREKKINASPTHSWVLYMLVKKGILIQKNTKTDNVTNLI